LVIFLNCLIQVAAMLAGAVMGWTEGIRYSV